ncbi:hypothetical protein HXX76_006684 [Chlamydomonas incerta]|uniref:Uncharacterized protein n=1 Tax=Chlamydomonas incerta TaxID=51695 RepID=A0A835W0S7_CHLIN|nr:hypothetical protein HXX76_006684 [Chlamydomonas incerta]|eukprot:KAG2436377.1 hypothetical protein HXX76_006684 [Chlamydomonas incerta]
MRQKRIWDASLYIPAGLFKRLPCVWCKCTPADYCCSACCKNCCECCDLRKSVLIAASWQFLIGGFLGATYAILTTVVLQYDLAQEGDNPVDLGLLIYLLAYWWLYFLSGVFGCCVTCDRQGILTYEQRVIVMCRGYVGLSIVDALGHLNPIVFDRNVFQSGLSRANIVLTLVPFMWDSYIAYLAWSLLKKLKEQRKGLFRGKPVMRHQRKPDHIVELHTAHHLELQPPQGQIILPLAQLRLRGLGPPPHGEPGAGGSSASFLAGWLNQQGYSNYTAENSLRKGLRAPGSAAAAAGGGGGGGAAADPADGTDFGDGASSVWNMRDSSAGDEDLMAGGVTAVDLGFSDGRPGSFVSLDGTARGPGSAVLDDSGGGRPGGRDRDREKERDSGGDGARSRSVLGSGGGGGGAEDVAGAAVAPPALVTAAPSTITDGATALTAIEEEDPGLAALSSPQRPSSPTRRASAYPVASASAQHPGSQHPSQQQQQSRHLSAPGTAHDAASPVHPWDNDQLAGVSMYGTTTTAAAGAPPPSAALSAHATQELDRRSLARSVASSTTAIAAVATATASAAAAAASNVAAWFNRSMAVAGGGGAKAAAAAAHRGAAGRNQQARDASPGAQGRAEEGSATPIFITGACPSLDAGGAVFELRMYSSAALPGRQPGCSAAAAAAAAAGAVAGGGAAAAHDRFAQHQHHVRHVALHHPHPHNANHHHHGGAAAGASGAANAAAAPVAARAGPSMGTHARSAAAQHLLPVLDPVVLPTSAAPMYGSALFGRTAAPPAHAHDGDGGSPPTQAFYPGATGVTSRAASVSVAAYRPTATSQSGFSGGDGSAAAIAAGLPTLQRAPSLQLPPPPGAGSKAHSSAAPALRPAPSMSRRAAFMKQMSIQRARTLPRGGATAAALELAAASAGIGAGTGASNGVGTGAGVDHSSKEPVGAVAASQGHGPARRAVGAPAASPMVSPFARQASAAHRGGAPGSGDPARYSHAHEPQTHSLPHPFIARAGQQPQTPPPQQQAQVSPVTQPTPGGARAGRSTSPHAQWSSGLVPTAGGAATASAAASLAGEPYLPPPLVDGGDSVAAAWRSPQPASTTDPNLLLQAAAVRTSRASSAYGSQHGVGMGVGAAGQLQVDAAGGGGAGGAGPRGVPVRRSDGGQSAATPAEQQQQQQQFHLQQQQVLHVHPHQAHVQAAATAAALQMHLPAMRGRGGGAGGGASAGPGGGAGRWARGADASAAGANTAATAAQRAPGVDASLRTGSVSTPKGHRANRLQFFYSAFGAAAADDGTGGAGEVSEDAAAPPRPRHRAASVHDSVGGGAGGGGTALVSRAASNASSAVGAGGINTGIAATWAAAAAAAVSGFAHSWGAQQQQQQQQPPQDSLLSQPPGTPLTGNSTPVARAYLPSVGVGGGGGAIASSGPDVAPLSAAADLPAPGDAGGWEGTYNPVFAWAPATGPATAAPQGARHPNQPQQHSSTASGVPPAAAATYRHTGTAAGAPTRFAARGQQQQTQRAQALRLQQQSQQQHMAAGAAGAAGTVGGTGASGEAAGGDAAAGRASAFASMLSPLQLPALAAAARGGAQSLYEGMRSYTSRAAAGAGAALPPPPPPQAAQQAPGANSSDHPEMVMAGGAVGSGFGDGGGHGRGGVDAVGTARPPYTEIFEGVDAD